ncbi:MAG: type II secretion system protein [Planctomycetota bacterium]
MSRRPGPRHGLTLAELLVVIGIISALCMLILPVVGAVLGTAHCTACCNNLRQIGTCLIAYATDHHGRLPAESNKGDLDPATSPAWFYRLPPYADRQDVSGDHTIFQCPRFDWQGPQVIDHASPKSYKMNAYLDNATKRMNHRFAGGHDSGVVLFIDAIAGETGMGQWGHCYHTAVDDTRHGGKVNLLYLDCQTVRTVEREPGKNWMTTLNWRP